MPPQPKRSARTKARLIATALKLFEEQGYDNTTVDQIVKQAGFSHMTFFRHFPSRDRLVSDAIDYHDWARTIGNAPLNLGPEEAIAWGTTQYFRNCAEPRLAAVLRVIATSESLSGHLFSPNAPWVEQMVDALRGRGIPDMRANIIVGGILGSFACALAQMPEAERWKADEPLALLAETFPLWETAQHAVA